MRRLLSLFCFLTLLLTGTGAQQTVKIQGVPRQVSADMASKIMRGPQRSAEKQKLDAEKVKFFVGEGSKTSYLVVEWRDGKGAEKLVWGYRWEDAETATGEAMVKAVAKADPRFFVLVMGGTQYGSAIGGFGFDLNGNQKNELMNVAGKDTTYIKPDGNNLISTGSYDFDNYSATDSTDHWCSGWYSNGYWSYNTAESTANEPGYSGVGATDRKLTDGCVDFWQFSPFSGEAAPEAGYYFYVPEPATGVALPGEITLPIADSGTLPVILGATGLEAKTFAWTITNEAGKRDYSIIKTIRSNAAEFNGAVTFTGDTAGIVKVLVSPTIGGQKYKSDTCVINVTAPEKPLTAIAFENAEMTAGLKQKVENPLVLTPADATYTGVTFSSSNKDVATVSSTGTVTATTKEGEAIITAVSNYDGKVTGSFKLTVKCQKPVEKIEMAGGDVIEMEERDIFCPEVTVTPADADYTDVSYTIADPSIASFYQANIVGHKAGETTMTVSALDGQGATATVRIIVKEPDRTPFAGYEDGTFILNEAWFGHENGDMNFITANDSLMYRVYERENPGEAFGATSCHATVYGGRIYVMSKQKADGGDLTTNPGGRLVVMDAKTLKKIAGFNEIGGGDGRSAVGVSPDKVYLGTTAGVVTFDAKNMKVGSVIGGTQGASLYSGQTGDMLKAGKYVFAVQQSKGTNVIDTEADTLVTTIEDSKIQGIAQTPDGKVWLASTNTLTRINPLTLETDSTVALPDGMTITCSWGSWRPTAFCASRTGNVLYWNGGAGVTGNGSAYFRYDLGTDISGIRPFFSLDTLKAADETKKQTSYGTIRYDDRTDELIVPTTQSGYGTSYEHNWIHIVDGTTGSLRKTIKLKQHYWFQAMPVFPDKYAPEFTGVENRVEMRPEDEAYVIDLTGKVTDADNLACNISTTLADSADQEIAKVEFNGQRITVTPVAPGTTTAAIEAESNGVVTRHEIEIKVDQPDGISANASARGIRTDGGRLAFSGYEGWRFMLYNTGGQLLRSFTVTTDTYTTDAGACSGTYILKGWHGNEAVSVKIAF